MTNPNSVIPITIQLPLALTFIPTSQRGKLRNQQWAADRQVRRELLYLLSLIAP
jgi:hypothetical protein